MGDPLAIQDEQHNTKMKCILILAALTVVTALPRADDTVPEVPPAIESSYAHAQGIYDDLLQTTDAQGATDACSQMAQAAEDGVNNNANTAQKLIDSIDDGSKCPQEGQSEQRRPNNTYRSAWHCTHDQRSFQSIDSWPVWCNRDTHNPHSPSPEGRGSSDCC